MGAKPVTGDGTPLELPELPAAVVATTFFVLVGLPLASVRAAVVNPNVASVAPAPAVADACEAPTSAKLESPVAVEVDPESRAPDGLVLAEVSPAVEDGDDPEGVGFWLLAGVPPVEEFWLLTEAGVHSDFNSRSIK